VSSCFIGVLSYPCVAFHYPQKFAAVVKRVLRKEVLLKKMIIPNL